MFIILAALALSAPTVAADTIRIASYQTGLGGSGPGLLLRDLGKEAPPPRLRAALAAIGAARPDILLLQGIDWDRHGRTAAALVDRLADEGLDYPHHLAPRPNAGMPAEDDPEALIGWGRYPGAGAVLLLSRYPLALERDFTGLPWRDLPGHDPGAPQELLARPLPSLAGFAARIDTPLGPITLGAMAATVPVFDGPEDANGRRNHDETALWLRFMAGDLGPPPSAPLVLAGLLQVDPEDGEGRRGALQLLLNHPRLAPARPASRGAVAAAQRQGGANARHGGDPALDNSDFRDDPGPGNLRAGYILAERSFRIEGAGTIWPAPGDALAPVILHDEAPSHRLIWADLALE